MDSLRQQQSRSAGPQSIWERLIAIFLISFFACNLLAEEEVDQEWVMSFDVQQRNNYIWDGKQAKSIEKLKEEFVELSEIQKIYELDTDIFAINGYYFSKDHLRASEPIIYSKLIELKSKRHDLEEDDLSESQKKVIREQVQRILNALPPKIDYENYLWHRYCRGLEKDMKDGIIIPKSDCSCCKGKGKIMCNSCNGQGKVGFYSPSIDVIDPDSKTRKIYLKQEIEKKIEYQESKKNYKKTESTPRTPMPGMPGMYGSMLDERGSSETKEEIQQKKEEDKARKLSEIEEQRRKKGQIECAICKGQGWRACPECVLVKKPHYTDSAKIQYMPRWSKLKSNKWL